MCGGGETSRRQLVHIRLIRVLQKFAHPNSIQIIATNQLCEWIQRKSNLFLTLKLDFTSVDYSIRNNIQTILFHLFLYCKKLFHTMRIISLDRVKRTTQVQKLHTRAHR